MSEEIGKCNCCVRNADKSKWGSGPWQNEPDRVQWEHAGTVCIAHRGPHGSWCGYAAVAPGHPLHGKGYSEVKGIECHWGLTYSDACTGCVCHVPAPGESDALHWFGFDFAHCEDYCPAMESHLPDHMRRGIGMSDHYWTLPEVQEEVNLLAEQLAVWKPEAVAT